MSARILLLATVGLIGFSTSTEAKLSLEQCKAMCGKADSCRGTYIRRLCNKDCPEVLGPDLCGGETAQAPTQLKEPVPQSPEPVRQKPPRPEGKPPLAKAEEIQQPLVEATPKKVVAEAMPEAKPDSTSDETQDNMKIVRVNAMDDAPPPAVNLEPLDPRTDKFFREFASDMVTVGNSLKCLTKSITVPPDRFRKSFMSKVKGSLDRYKNLPYNPYPNYAEYQMDLGQYFESMINLNIMEAFQQWTKNSIKAQAEFQGLIQRAIRFTEGVAKKIPGYNPSTNRTSGADMMGPYLFALPDDKLEELNKCISSNGDSAHNPTLKNFYEYFLNKIKKETTARTSRENDDKIEKSMKKLAKR